MASLENARNKINEIDKKMAALFEERMNAVKEVAAYKTEHSLPIKDQKREDAIIANNSNYISDSALIPYYVEFMHDVMNISCNYQEELMNTNR